MVSLQVSDPLSLYNVKSRWLQEIEKHTSAPLILCGCMADLRWVIISIMYTLRIKPF